MTSSDSGWILFPLIFYTPGQDSASGFLFMSLAPSQFNYTFCVINTQFYLTLKKKDKMIMTITKGSEEEQIKKLLEKLRKKRSARKKGIAKYCGVLSLKENPLTLQKQWRDEWRRKYGLKLPDAIFAGSALSLNVPLVTADKKMSRVKEIDMIYYQSF